MVQFNLLPDVKIQFLKARRQKRIVVSVASLVVVASIVVFVIMLMTVQIFQKKHITDLSKDIQTASKQLEGTQDLNKILTVQNQLAALPGLHDKKPVASRVFGYLSQLTPSAASISKVSIDFSKSTITITGSADKISTINTFVDTLKFTKYKTTESTAQKSAFSDVVMTSFTRGAKEAAYTIDVKFDNTLFNVTKEVTMVVPNIVTTRSEVEQPTALFQQTKTTGNQ
jgi:Tfp pilus assembly protein PilN